MRGVSLPSRGDREHPLARGHYRRNAGDDRSRGDGWDTSGTREPRRPIRPLMPSRAEAVDSDSSVPSA